MHSYRKLATGFAALLTGVALIGSLSVAQIAFAHTDPIGCSASGVGLSLTAFRSDGTTAIGGGLVAPGETIVYKSTLSHLGGTNCNFEGGTLSITTPDGVLHTVASPATPVVPLVTFGAPFTSVGVNYVVSYANSGGDGILDATSNYSGGTSHTPTAHSTVGANNGISVVMEGRIIVDKVSVPSSEQDFEFDPSWAVNFFLDDTDAPVDSGPLVLGAYSVAEVNLPVGWNLTNTTCVSSLQDSETAGSLDLDAGETITCTFTNTLQKGNIIVDKVTDPSGDLQSFNFDASGGSYADFSLTDAAAPNNQALDAGNYSVAETVPAGWDLTNTTCVSSILDVETAASLELDPGETITCTFNNQKDSKIIVVKQTNPDGSAQSFEFDPSYGGNFFLTDGQQNDSGDLSPGSYSVAEVNIPANWNMTGATCSDGSPVGNISLQAGETVTCTFNNTFTPPAGQYCSPGYWKQSQHFDSWVTYTPGQTFLAVFGRNITVSWSAKGKPGPLTNPTLLQALEANGGGISKLARVAVDGLLNSTSMNSGFTAAQVIAIVQNAIDTGNYALVDQFSTPENCPLN